MSRNTTVAPVLGSEGLALSYYGDDFTGSTDVMEVLELAGVPTVLFLDAPTREQVAAYEGIAAVGVAGISRTMSPDEMTDALPGLFERIKALAAPVFHYKICSTFDSSPGIGSIGRAAEIVRDVFDAETIPLVVGAPKLGRYTAFGHLFARADGRVHRLDRHPTMATHPMTPMNEADLLAHLAEQTTLPGALVDLRATGGGDDIADAEVDAAFASDAVIVALDVLDDETERQVGRSLDRLVRARAGDETLAVIGSSGVEYALARVWRSETTRTRTDAPVTIAQTVVLVGSRAPATDAQVEAALAAGFADVPVDPFAVTNPDTAEAAVADIVSRAVDAYSRDTHVLIRTPPKTGSADVDGTRLAEAMGRIALALGRAIYLPRLVVAGGDTSGLVTRAIGIEALRLIQPLAPGAPLCRATSSDPRFDGMEICLKAGQIGAPDYFIRIARLAAPGENDMLKERNT